MNQILSVGNNDKKNKKSSIKANIQVFAILLVIVATGILLISIYSFNLRKKNVNDFAIPQIEILAKNENKIVIKGYCEDGISKVTYIWNNESQNLINLNGDTSFEREINIPYKKINVLKVEMITENNIKGEVTKEFNVDVDDEKPKIDEITVSGAKLNILASDNAGIEYIEYNWEGEEPNRIDAVSDDNRTMNAQINIERGTYKLTIKVVDINGNVKEESRLVTGVNEPEIRVIRYGDIINIDAVHDMGIKQISVLINNKEYTYNEESADFTKQNEVQVEYPLEEGENTVKIIVFC